MKMKVFINTHDTMSICFVDTVTYDKASGELFLMQGETGWKVWVGSINIENIMKSLFLSNEVKLTEYTAEVL